MKSQLKTTRDQIDGHVPGTKRRFRGYPVNRTRVPAGSTILITDVKGKPGSAKRLITFLYGGHLLEFECNIIELYGTMRDP